MKQVFEVVAVETDPNGNIKQIITNKSELILAHSPEDAKVKWAALNSQCFSENGFDKEVTLLARPFVKTVG